MPRISVLLLGLSFAAGCSKSSSDTAPPESRQTAEGRPRGDAQAQASRAPTMRADLHSPGATGVHIDATLATVCELSTDDDFFVYDPDNRDASTERVLASVSRCVTDGPLAGRRLELVTYAAVAAADAKPQAYTRTEGLRTALMRGGMAEGDLVMAAETGDAEVPEGAVGWPNERRVDLRIAPRRSH